MTDKKEENKDNNIVETNKDEKEAYKIVLEDLTKCGCGLFVGQYDAKNGKAEFMYGISTVMEHIAYKSGKKEYEEFSKTFFENMEKSEKKC